MKKSLKLKKKWRATNQQMEKLPCTLCEQMVHLSARTPHIYYKHMKEKFIRCPYCDYGDEYNIRIVKDHIKNVHKG